MSNSPKPEDIILAVKESGYLMEQEVASQLEALGFHVQTNRAYKDQDEGKSREIDVSAIKRIAHNEEKNISVFIEILAECKNNSNPFIFIGRQKNTLDNRRPPEEFFSTIKYSLEKQIGPNARSVQDKPAFFHLALDKFHYGYKESTKAVQFCQIDRKSGNWKVNHGGIYDAIFYPIIKALNTRKKEVSGRLSYSGPSNIWFFFPIVVLSGDIYYIDSAQEKLEPTERDFVRFKREIDTTNLKGEFALDFIKQNSLENFISLNVNPLCDRLKYLVEQTPDDLLKRGVSEENLLA